jgi:hypothetical protein
MRPTVENLQAIWLFAYSRSSFVDAVKFLDELDKVVPRSLQYRALVEAAVVALCATLQPLFPATQPKGRAARWRFSTAAFSERP